MKVLTPRMHGVLDYVMVIVFAVAPTALGLSGLPATIAYTLAGVHLLLTLATDFAPGILRIIPFPIHGMIEIVVSALLVALPWVAGFAGETAARNFYLAVGVVIFIVWLLTDYRSVAAEDAVPITATHTPLP